MTDLAKLIKSSKETENSNSLKDSVQPDKKRKKERERRNKCIYISDEIEKLVQQKMDEITAITGTQCSFSTAATLLIKKGSEKTKNKLIFP